MRFVTAAALAMPVLFSAGAGAAPDLSVVTPMAGSWSYANVTDGSEARFVGPTGAVQLTLHCKRATRRVTITKPATGAAASMDVWTSGAVRAVPVTFDPTAGRLSADLGAYDTLLDGMSNSRGRIGFTVGTQPSLVVPAWPEVARVVEDCRA